MNIFLSDPDEERLPPEEVRLREMQVVPYPDSGRVKIFLELTPFMKRPSVEVTITGKSGRAARTSILESMTRKLEFTMHLREFEAGSENTLEVTVYYQRLPEPSEVSAELPLPEPMIVDRKKTTFTLPISEP